MAFGAASGFVVVGATGYLGRVVADVLTTWGPVLSTHHTKPGSQTSALYDFWHDDVAELLRRCNAKALVFAAAVARTTEAGEHPVAVYRATIRRFVDACRGTRLVYISSDAVFDGTKGSYRESDPASPVTKYGRNHLEFEEIVRSTHSDFCIIRPSYLFGFSRELLDKRLSAARLRTLAGEEIECPLRIYKSPLEVNQAAYMISEIARSQYNGIIHIGGRRLSLFEFYSEGLRALGLSPRVRSLNVQRDIAGQSDTSLDSSLAQSLTSVRPLPIWAALNGGNDFLQ